ncbi:glycosyltransferase family 2 protein [Halorubrum salsamenti]|uniref:glycosyltransferase family 2 protein n=1 Tax=Halorubrum salsamenti TaxID=2583990 RepID=UPI00119E9E37|nr:glycosyltransferase family A protein [Halorubrum salsamenti]
MSDGDQSSADRPLVSVILPTYNRPKKLREAVHSVTEQSYPAIELIVVDDHSSEPATVALKETNTESLSSMRVVRHEENRGANAARNTGIRRASGDLISFLDDDDRWLTRKTDRQVSRFENGPDDLGVVTVSSRTVDEAGNQIGVVRSSVEGDAVGKLLRGGIVGSFSRVMAKADVISEAGLLDESFPSWQDREWYLRLAQHCRFGSEDEVLVERRIDANHRISDDFEQKRDVSYPRFLEKHRDLAAERGLLAERRFVAGLSRTLAFSGLVNGYYRESIKYLLISLAYYPFDPKTYLYLCLAAGGPFTFKSAQRIKRRYSRTLSTLE